MVIFLIVHDYFYLPAFNSAGKIEAGKDKQRLLQVRQNIRTSYNLYASKF